MARVNEKASPVEKTELVFRSDLPNVENVDLEIILFGLDMTGLKRYSDRHHRTKKNPGEKSSDNLDTLKTTNSPDSSADKIESFVSKSIRSLRSDRLSMSDSIGIDNKTSDFEKGSSKSNQTSVDEESSSRRRLARLERRYRKDKNLVSDDESNIDYLDYF